jgi:phosphoglycerate dehydrogenase-like enzyme
LLQGTWAGIDPILSYLDDNKPSPNISVCRFSHPIFSQLITEYVVAHVINSERGFSRKMVQAQTDREWITEQASNHRPLKEIKIGILGVGQMGKSIAKMFKV